MINRSEVLKNVVDNDEKVEIAKIYDKYLLAFKNYEITYSDFLNPALLVKVYNIFKYDNDVDIKIQGGFKTSERNIVVFINKNLYEMDYNLPLSFCKISYNKKYSKILQHKDFLGAIIGIGIKREKLGDINLFDEYAIVTVYKDITSYITNNLEYVGKTKVCIAEVTLDDCENIMQQKEKKEKVITVSSLRIDTVISTIFNLSRSNASKIINSEKVFLNWSVCSTVSKEIAEGDIVTVRGYGRVQISNSKGRSKKGKEILNIILY